MEIQEAVGTLLDVTKSPDLTKIIVRLGGEIELQLAPNRPSKLHDELRCHMGRKIGLLWFNDANGDQVVRVRELGEDISKEQASQTGFRKLVPGRNHGAIPK